MFEPFLEERAATKALRSDDDSKNRRNVFGTIAQRGLRDMFNAMMFRDLPSDDDQPHDRKEDVNNLAAQEINAGSLTHDLLLLFSRLRVIHLVGRANFVRQIIQVEI